MKLASIIGISLLGFSSFLAYAVDITNLPTLTLDSISLTDVLDQTVRVSVRSAGCPETAIELTKDELLAKHFVFSWSTAALLVFM
ncbi:hypothetical protein [Thauera sp.]|uniref:hypothetical protein n=1 Tax=Thauera sp. TaxID=1905334 RepID=UPI0039E2CE3C